MAFGKLEAKEVLRSTHKSPAADLIPTFVRNIELSLNHFRRDLKTVYFRLPTWSGELVTFLGYTRARTSNLRTELTWRAWLVGEMSSYSSSALQRTVLWWTVETTAGREGEAAGRRRSDNGGVVETHGGGGVVSTYLSSTCGRRRTVTCHPRRRQLRLRTDPAPPDRQPTQARVL